MLKIISDKKWTAVIIILLILFLGWGVFMSFRYFYAQSSTKSSPTLLTGTCSVDGGEEFPCDADGFIEARFHHIVIRGKLPAEVALYRKLTVCSKNVWYRMTDSAGNTVIEYQPLKVNTDDKEISEEFDAPFMHMPETPGYKTLYHTLDLPSLSEWIESGIDPKSVSLDEIYTLEVDFPYAVSNAGFSDCFYVLMDITDSTFSHFFYQPFPVILLFVLICFFGLFFFPIASAVMGKTDYRYMTFGVLCFFWGVYMILQSARDYLNLWILDPTVCMMADKLSGYFFVLSILFYIKSNLQKTVTRAIANITATVFFIAIVTVTILHVAGVSDLVATSPVFQVMIAVCALMMIVLLALEIRGNRNTLIFMISWIPLMLGLIVDIADQFVYIPGSHFFMYGIGITILYQIIRLIYGLRLHYKEAIRYEQMKKELYEAEVQVMVSQIRPHFMYNALSSIAMLCKLDPDTAYNATIQFSDYLRGNMDSLKNTEPVPFEKELAHLEKYLYIEKLRFKKKLNVEYDIQTRDFEVPQLSVQPLVENAVKHGVGMKKEGGTVRIATRETEDACEIIISDDGVGFDPEEVKQRDDGRSHVGMENTRKRLKDMCGATITVTSTVGEGTEVRVTIPKADKENSEVRQS
ncbi:MAG: histidine kinase [Eubacterium sp.]|nr:histidine kinase [Eubacterium sp.]